MIQHEITGLITCIFIVLRFLSSFVDILLWVFVTHFCYHLKFWNFSQVFVENYLRFELFLSLIFLLALEVLSYARKSCSLNNACIPLKYFISNPFELAKVFFVSIKRLSSQSSFDNWFGLQCVLYVSLA